MSLEEKKVQVYPNGKPCHHCIWISGLNKQFGWAESDPVCVFKENRSKEFLGSTVFNSHPFLLYTFNCVAGVRDNPSGANHHFWNIFSALKGALNYAYVLYSSYGVQDTNILLNSNFDLKKHGRKEHCHALLTIPEKERYKVFKQSRWEKGRTITDEPYKGDIVIKLSDTEIDRLLTSGNRSWTYVKNLISNALRIDIDASKDSFYIFLKAHCDREGCRIVSGKIAVDPKVLEKTGRKK